MNDITLSSKLQKHLSIFDSSPTEIVLYPTSIEAFYVYDKCFTSI